MKRRELKRELVEGRGSDRGTKGRAQRIPVEKCDECNFGSSGELSERRERRRWKVFLTFFKEVK